VTVPGGLYVGTEMAPVMPGLDTEPALLDPTQKVNLARPADGTQMDYWPSYSTITPAERGAYLRWLQAGRTGDVHIGYVFLFFYGIERRVLHGANVSPKARREIPALLQETKRLLDLYGQSSSFEHYASNLIAVASFARAKQVSDLTPPRRRIRSSTPVVIELAIRRLASQRKPLPGEWALAWARLGASRPPRVPVTRCPKEFDQLFLARYADRFGDGLRLKPLKSSRPFAFVPASASFDVAEPAYLLAVQYIEEHQMDLAELFESVTDELSAYSRHIGRHGDRQSTQALALLPAPLIPQVSNSIPQRMPGARERRSSAVSSETSRASASAT
jgi:TerB N-terminal domain